MLAFFPWLQIEEQLTAGEYRLIPYVRGKEPGSSTTKFQKQLDSVLRPYRTIRSESIIHATLVQFEGKQLTEELSDDEVNGLFVLAEMVALAGLSTREFFHWNYWNRDNFRLVVQAFRSPLRGVAVSSRRRDGQSTRAMSYGSYDVLLPAHVHLSRKIEIDAELLRALLSARGSSLWPRLVDCITSFNLANTDSDTIVPQVEAVLMIGAFERLLGCESGKEHQLATALEAIFTSIEPVLPDNCSRSSVDPHVTKKFREQPSVREGWIRDFFRLRGGFAHGKMGSEYASIWSMNEHLLLGAYLLPLIVKQLLAREGYLPAGPKLLADLDVFERLACASHFEPLPDGAPGADGAWRRIRESERFGAEVRRLLTQSNQPTSK